MTDKQFEALMGKMDQLIGAVNNVGESLAELAADLTCDNKGDSYRLPELLFTIGGTGGPVKADGSPGRA